MAIQLINPQISDEKIRPYFRCINDSNEWFDGKNFRKPNKEKDIYRIQEILMMYDLGRRHIDGVFTCPRCRMHHNLTDAFEEFCDECFPIIYPLEVSKRNARSIAHWSGKIIDDEINKKIQYRQAYEVNRSMLFPNANRYTPICF